MSRGGGAPGEVIAAQKESEIRLSRAGTSSAFCAGSGRGNRDYVVGRHSSEAARTRHKRDIFGWGYGTVKSAAVRYGVCRMGC